MPEFVIPPAIHEEIKLNGLRSVLKTVRTAKGRVWDFTVVGEVQMVLFSDMTYGYLYVISSGADDKAYNAALASIKRVSPPFKKFLVWNWRKGQTSIDVSAATKSFIEVCGEAPVRENAIILRNKVEGLIAEYVVSPPAGFKPMVAKSWVTPANFAELEPKLLVALTSRA